MTNKTGASDIEAVLRQTVERDGVHVVHFWAPWCPNAVAELAPVWAEAPARHPDASFTFVSLWAEGDDGADLLRQHGVPEAVARIAAPGPKPEAAERRTTLLGLPVTWIPTTWVFNRGGLLATAFNHGEVTAAQLAEAVEGAARDWSR
jgi:hypothetical protein